MRFPYLVALILTLAGAGTFWYKSTAAICPVPLTYRVGQIDSHFNLDIEAAKKHLAKAEAVWEESAGRELFIYDEKATLVVDFIFDERQAEADIEVTEQKALDTKKTENDTLVKTIEDLQKEYDSLSESYKKRVGSYEARLNAYNDKVNSYNDQGGAPGDVFSELEQERVSLNVESKELSKKADELTTLSNKINELSERGNALVEKYNEEVVEYNKKFGYAREFTQGDYQGERINVYKFSDDAELLAVLTHELGHALGLEHVEGESSVMYYLLKDTTSAPVLSKDDEAAFVAQCGTGKEWPHRVRTLIRSLLPNH
jgi:predicted RNase H-like nuclease (RuvC/YqgF family)